MSADPYSAAIVTFKRPDSLRKVLEGLAGQEHRPSLVVVADNDPAQSARQVVLDFAERSPVEVIYLPIGENLGPAGGWARAAHQAAEHESRGAWIAVFDDDDPVTHPQVMARLGVRAGAAAPDVAAIGLRGSRLRRWSATVERVHGVAHDNTAVDYLASGGAPLYRWSAIDEVGFFDERLFFGFEDLELGIRLRGSGMQLLLEPAEDIHAVPDTAAVRTEWREYYKTRALVVICRRHLGSVPLAATLVRVLILATPRLLLLQRRPSLIVARWRGVRDGLAGRLGPRAYLPVANPAKPRPAA